MDDAGSSFHDPPHAGRSLRQSSQMLPPPISKIPNEVLAEIFKHCIPILGDVSRPLKNVAPILLCRVCSSWQTLTRSTPELWKSMTIYVPITMKDASPSTHTLQWPGPLSVTEQPSISWHQLTLVDCGGLMGYAALEIIQNCPELQEFNFRTERDWDSYTRLPCRPLVLHKRLCKVLLYAQENSELLLDSLILPALDDLCFFAADGSDEVSIIFQQQLLRLFTRSKCMLDKLALNDCISDSSLFPQCLRHESLLNLTLLKISSVSVTDDVLLQLTHLVLVLYVTASSGILGRMVWSKCRPSKKENRLKMFQFNAQNIDKADEDYIERARRHGLEVVSDYGDY
ncbi:hypothetical protein AX17_002610 [Amanita inopinata Kibby_2008]|nr:hypothetical protein AX17_002610 [Amanita inopinata Kibby_2008]